MGIIGQAIGAEVGSHIGGFLVGKINGKYADSGSRIGGAIGGLAGTLAPYKKGGYVKGKKGAPIPILAHGGEFILSLGVKPTKKQIALQKKLRMK